MLQADAPGRGPTDLNGDRDENLLAHVAPAATFFNTLDDVSSSLRTHAMKSSETPRPIPKPPIHVALLSLRRHQAMRPVDRRAVSAGISWSDVLRPSMSALGRRALLHEMSVLWVQKASDRHTLLRVRVVVDVELPRAR